MNLLNKIYIFTKVIIFLATFVSVSSCTGMLEPTPVTNLLDTDMFATPDRVLSQVNGLYSSLKSGQFLGGRMQMYMDVRGEEFENVSQNGVTGLFAWNYSQAPSNAEVTNAWTAGYLTINRVNLFLKGLDDNPNVVPVATANQYRAEARFIRATAYFYLSQLYCRPFSINMGNTPGLPLRLTANTTNTSVDLARSTVAEVYTQILNDLNFAEANAIATYGNALLNTTRSHRNTMISMKVRVNLVMGNWAAAITEAQKIVAQTASPFSSTSGVTHSIIANIVNVFSAPYTSAENIFSMPMSSADVPGTQNDLAGYYLPASSTLALNGRAEYPFDPLGILANPAFSAANDARRNALTVVSGGRTWCAKYRVTPPPTDFVPVIRYSEVILSYAEALVRQNNTIDPTALALLNAVRGRSNPTGVYTLASFANSTALLNAILLERRIELYGEGMRSIDITRQGLALPAKTGVTNVPTTAQNYIWPIPQSEMDTNKLMTQN
ncbi:MAG: RagB/SusD family nutrient uptake outer membrane protein [Bacteroidetes bacterium]|nr:MAG: RagB/SusD family nutrient uptake outer membrane protein [Bacteroidota bacterium]TAG86966.1 MAG: RagB/SusD family nutrient uptake outer membrane protein [Bacteroidota bacterium]